MHRVIAGSLLVMILAGIFAPAAMALSQDSQHACCLRKASHCRGDAQAEPALFSGGCAQHSCCRFLAVRQWAQIALRVVPETKKPAEPATVPALAPLRRSEMASSHSGRAPPIFLVG